VNVARYHDAVLDKHEDATRVGQVVMNTGLKACVHHPQSCHLGGCGNWQGNLQLAPVVPSRKIIKAQAAARDRGFHCHKYLPCFRCRRRRSRRERLNVWCNVNVFAVDERASRVREDTIV